MTPREFSPTTETDYARFRRPTPAPAAVRNHDLAQAHRAPLMEADGFDEQLRGFEAPDLCCRLEARACCACLPLPLTLPVRTACGVRSHLAKLRRGTVASYCKNRALLPEAKRGASWRVACGGALTSPAKTAWRAGDRRHAWACTRALAAPSRAPVPGALDAGLAGSHAARRTALAAMAQYPLEWP